MRHAMHPKFSKCHPAEADPHNRQSCEAACLPPAGSSPKSSKRSMRSSSTSTPTLKVNRSETECIPNFPPWHVQLSEFVSPSTLCLIFCLILCLLSLYAPSPQPAPLRSSLSLKAWLRQPLCLCLGLYSKRGRTQKHTCVSAYTSQKEPT